MRRFLRRAGGLFGNRSRGHSRSLSHFIETGKTHIRNFLCGAGLQRALFHSFLGVGWTVVVGNCLPVLFSRGADFRLRPTVNSVFLSLSFAFWCSRRRGRNEWVHATLLITAASDFAHTSSLIQNQQTEKDAQLVAQSPNAHT